MKIFRTWQSITILYSLLLVFVLPCSSKASPTFISATRPDLPNIARGVPMGGAIMVFDLDLDEIGSASLELERFSVFEPGTQLIVDNNYSVAPPTDAYFRGHVTELPASIAILAIPEKGAIRGIITDDSGVWLLAGNSGQSSPGLSNRKVNLEAELEGKPFECGTEQILQNAINLLPTAGEGGFETASLQANVTHTARVAVETDYEYYAKFGNVDAAFAYMADLFAYASTVYEQEVNTNLVISWSRLWTGGANSDPWNASRATDSALYEFQDYWNSGSDVNIPTTRTIAHMLSGKSLGGGIAYVGVLCYSYYGYSTNYDFGLSASLSGNFNVSNSSVVWDILVVTHEIGHNFDSPHTHDYCGIGGNSSPVDLCYSSADGCGTQLGLPGINSLSGGTTSEKPGTIMSYCHLISGGYSNIKFTFGQDHIYGIDAFRVPDVMKNHVAASALSTPQCLALDNGNPILTVNKTGSGNGLVTSLPEGIYCGTNCTASFPDGEFVTLTAVADPGSEFTSWSGDCTNNQFTMDTDTNCTATFTSLCGNGILDMGEDCDGSTLAEGVDCGGCVGTPSCNADCSIDMTPCYNNVCDETENCDSCPLDCIGGTFIGAVCGNGICEAGDGEDCVSCPTDCNGVQGGKPSGRFCCGDGDGKNPVGCSDERCGAPETCTDIFVPGVDYCCGDGSCSGPEDGYNCELDCGAPPYCGDGICNAGEDQCNCEADCGTPPPTETAWCSDKIDNDCDGNIDAADSDCPSINCSDLTQIECNDNPTCRWHPKKGCVER